MKVIKWNYTNKEGLPSEEKEYLVAFANLHNQKKYVRVDKWINKKNTFQSIDMICVYAWAEITPPPKNTKIF